MLKINKLEFLDDHIMQILFEDGKEVKYDIKEDLNLPGYDILKDEDIFRSGEISQSKCFVRWNNGVDLPSDILYEYGKAIG